MSLVPVYQYHSTKYLQRYLYTTLPSLDGTSWNSPPQDDCKHWINDGVAFYGCGSGDPNAVPVYQMYANISPGTNNDAKKYFFSLNPSQQGEGWYQSSDTPAFYAYPAQDAGLLEFTLWYTAEPQYSFFLGNSAQGGSLAPPAGWQPAGWATGPGQASQPFYALPGAAKPAYAFKDLSFSNVSLPKGNPSVMATQAVQNNSAATASQAVTFQLSQSATVALALTETIGESETAKVTAGIPGLGSAEGSTTTSLNLSSTQTVTQQVQQAITVTGTVTVPPNTSVTVQAIVYVATDISLPFSLDCLVTAQLSNQDVGLPSSGSCAALIDLFRQHNPNFNGSITPAPSLNGIVVTMSGKMTGSYAVNAEMDIENASGSTTMAAAAGSSGGRPAIHAVSAKMTV